MKTVTIRDLHQSTGAIVREAASEPTVITDCGHPVAVLKPVSPADLPGKRFPDGHGESINRPVLDADSTSIVSESRER